MSEDESYYDLKALKIREEFLKKEVEELEEKKKARKEKFEEEFERLREVSNDRKEKIRRLEEKLNMEKRELEKENEEAQSFHDRHKEKMKKLKGKVSLKLDYMSLVRVEIEKREKLEKKRIEKKKRGQEKRETIPDFSKDREKRRTEDYNIERRSNLPPRNEIRASQRPSTFGHRDRNLIMKPSKVLHFGNLPFEITETNIQEAIESYGFRIDVNYVEIKRSRPRSFQRTVFAFVMFPSTRIAEDFIEKYRVNVLYFNDRRTSVNFSRTGTMVRHQGGYRMNNKYAGVIWRKERRTSPSGYAYEDIKVKSPSQNTDSSSPRVVYEVRKSEEASRLANQMTTKDDELLHTLMSEGVEKHKNPSDNNHNHSSGRRRRTSPRRRRVRRRSQEMNEEEYIFAEKYERKKGSTSIMDWNERSKYKKGEYDDMDIITMVQLVFKYGMKFEWNLIAKDMGRRMKLLRDFWDDNMKVGSVGYRKFWGEPEQQIRLRKEAVGFSGRLQYHIDLKGLPILPARKLFHMYLLLLDAQDDQQDGYIIVGNDRLLTRRITQDLEMEPLRFRWEHDVNRPGIIKFEKRKIEH